MRKFGFITVLCPTNAFLAHNEFQVKCHGGDAEQLIKKKFINILGNDIVGNETQNKIKGE